MRDRLTYGDFYSTGLQDCANAWDGCDHKESWRELGYPSDPVAIVNHAWEANEDRDAWIDSQCGDFDGLDPVRCYTEWSAAWKQKAVSIVAGYLYNWIQDRERES
jgi:hypothetical protein